MQELTPHEQLQKLLTTIESETLPFPSHTDPKAITDCWRLAHDLIDEMINHCSHLAAGQCLYSLRLGDGGHAYCSEVQRLREERKEQSQRIQQLEEVAKSSLNRLHIVEMQQDNDFDAEPYRKEIKRIEALLKSST